MTEHPSPNYDPRIRAALDRAIELGETGITVAAYYRGKLIVDVFAGLADPGSGKPVDEHTLFSVFSVTKGVTALAVHIQAERGLLNLQKPISRYWPAFANNSKESITIEQALSHRAGIPQMPKDVTPELMANWDWMVEHIAQHAPIFPPGSTNAYHILVWGWILGEVVRRTDPAHRPFDVFVNEEICKPLGITDFYLGVPDAELQRVATLSGGNSFIMVDEHNISPKSVFPDAEVHNLQVIRQSLDPGAGAITTAGAVARIFALMAEGGELDGVRLLSPESTAGLTKIRENPHDPDKILPIPIWFGAAGFWLGGEPNVSDPLVGDHREIIYSPGAGGSLAWADLRDRIAVAICHNNMDTVAVLKPERTFAPIVRAVREIIEEQRERN